MTIAESLTLHRGFWQVRWEIVGRGSLCVDHLCFPDSASRPNPSADPLVPMDTSLEAALAPQAAGSEWMAGFEVPQKGDAAQSAVGLGFAGSLSMVPPIGTPEDIIDEHKDE